ncbi:HD domain-containing protein [Arenimonas sp.]|uniref:HD domain-containing protein n=1 Tax=Arenimonas sp. TaxID=1872635 RepID=UPI0035B0848B
MTALTHRYTQAIDYARIAHAAQFRKGSKIPYIYHLLGVSSLVLEYGGTEDQAIAGLLHDVLEDCGAAHEATIRAQFGDAVATIVKDCTDGTAEGKAATTEDKVTNWTRRKLKYISHIKAESRTSLLVTACDKLHNARAILADLHGKAGMGVFRRFTAGKLGTLQYYEAISQVLLKRAGAKSSRLHELAHEFDRAVGQIHKAAGAKSRVPLRKNSLVA